jgi:hypothetical protein
MADEEKKLKLHEKIVRLEIVPQSWSLYALTVAAPSNLEINGL